MYLTTTKINNNNNSILASSATDLSGLYYYKFQYG